MTSEPLPGRMLCALVVLSAWSGRHPWWSSLGLCALAVGTGVSLGGWWR